MAKGGLVKTARGEMLDMNKLTRENEKTLAVSGGGVSMNSRGDLLGRGGKVIKTREQLEVAYNRANKNATHNVSLKKPSVVADINETVSLEQVSEAFKKAEERAKKRKTGE
jgi:hypothetical protein